MPSPSPQTQEHRLTFDSGQLSDRDEVWDGEYVVAPMATIEHQWIAIQLAAIFLAIIDRAGGDRVYQGLNVSDREAGWTHNFRIPDVGVVLSGNPAKNCGTHLCGGPDVVVEVLSKADRAREKADFYGAIGVREYWIIDPDPLRLDLLRSDGERLVTAGTIVAGSSVVVQSAAVPLTLRVVTGGEGPQFEIRHSLGHPIWSI